MLGVLLAEQTHNRVEIVHGGRRGRRRRKQFAGRGVKGSRRGHIAVHAIIGTTSVCICIISAGISKRLLHVEHFEAVHQILVLTLLLRIHLTASGRIGAIAATRVRAHVYVVADAVFLQELFQIHQIERRVEVGLLLQLIGIGGATVIGVCA